MVRRILLVFLLLFILVQLALRVVWGVGLALLILIIALLALSAKYYMQAYKDSTPPKGTPPTLAAKSEECCTQIGKPETAAFFSIYEYVGEKGKVRCYHCDGENDWSQHSCRICGNSLISER